MTLGRLTLAWLVAALWFVVADWGIRRMAGDATRPDAAARRRATGWIAVEGGVVTLFASLWFDSLGSGGWWLLFVLVGLLAAFPVRLQAIAVGALPARPTLLVAVLDTARYVGAGALLAWRLR